MRRAWRAAGAAAVLIPAMLTATSMAACPTAATGASCGGAFARGGTTAKRIAAPPSQRPRYAVGDTLPPGRYFRIVGSAYLGLPPVTGDWRYYEVEGRVLRVRPDTLEVVGDATDEANRAF